MKIERNKQIQYFKLTESILLPIKRTKLLLIGLLMLGFIHLSFFNEKPSFNQIIDTSGLSKSAAISYRLHTYELVEYILNENTKSFEARKNVKFIYLGYFLLFSSLLFSVKILPVDIKSE